MISDQLIYLSDDNFEFETRNGIILVDFYADWCGPCRMMEPTINELADELAGRAKIAKLDIEAAQRVTGRFQVTSVPTFVLLRDGQEIKRTTGVKDKDALKLLIQAELGV